MNGARMRPWGVLVGATIGLSLACGGCAGLLLHSAGKGDEPRAIPLGSTRDDVVATLGEPVGVVPLPDGGQTAVYAYRLDDPKMRETGKTAAGMWLVWVGGYGGAAPVGIFTEPFFLPYAIYKIVRTEARGPEGRVTLTFAPDGRLLHLGGPPPYGPPDDSVEQPSLGILRRGCWMRPGADELRGSVSEVSEGDRHAQCVSRALAIWGSE